MCFYRYNHTLRLCKTVITWWNVHFKMNMGRSHDNWGLTIYVLHSVLYKPCHVLWREPPQFVFMCLTFSVGKNSLLSWYFPGLQFGRAWLWWLWHRQWLRDTVEAFSRQRGREAPLAWTEHSEASLKGSWVNRFLGANFTEKPPHRAWLLRLDLCCPDTWHSPAPAPTFSSSRSPSPWNPASEDRAGRRPFLSTPWGCWGLAHVTSWRDWVRGTLICWLVFCRFTENCLRSVGLIIQVTVQTCSSKI